MVMVDNNEVINKFKDFLNNVRTKFRRGPKTDAEADDASMGLPPEPARVAEKGARAPSSFMRNLLKTSGLMARFQKGSWASLPDKLLAKESLTGHHRTFLLALLLVTTYSIGKITAIVLRGRPQFDSPSVAISDSRVEFFDFNTLNKVKSADPFKTTSAQGKPAIADTKCDDGDGPTNLPLKLVNTVVLQDSVKSIASVQIRSGRDLKEVREGDSLEGLAKIFHITRLQLVIKNLETGACEFLTSDKAREKGTPIGIMPKAKGEAFKAQQKIKGIDNVGNKYSISKELLNDKLKDINQVLTQARAIKIQNPDGSLAFKITEIEPGGIFAYLGIQNDDIITSIDGRPISDLNEVMGLFGRLKNIDKLKLGVRREGEESELDYAMKQ